MITMKGRHFKRSSNGGGKDEENEDLFSIARICAPKRGLLTSLSLIPLIVLVIWITNEMIT